MGRWLEMYAGNYIALAGLYMFISSMFAFPAHLLRRVSSIIVRLTRRRHRPAAHRGKSRINQRAIKLAVSGVAPRFQCLDAIGVKADIARASRACRSEAIDPGCVKTLEAIVGAQQKNRSHSLDESFMRGRPSLCTNLVPERPIEWFSHSQDPKQTFAGLKSCSAAVHCRF